MTVQALTLFCEDLRHERTGQETLVGTLPDRISVPAATGPNETAMLRIVAYTKIYFSGDEPPTSFTLRTIDSDGTVIGTAEVSAKLLERANALRGEMAEYGVKNSMSFTLFGRTTPSFIQVEMMRGGQTVVTGKLYFDRPEARNIEPEEASLGKRAKRRSKKELLSSAAAPKVEPGRRKRR